MMEPSPFIGDWHRSIKLGCGTFSEIWLWKHAKSKEEIAVKTYKLPTNANAEKYRERHEAEIDIMMNKVRHLNIVRGVRIEPNTFLIELSKESIHGLPILITQYCNGGDLRRKLNDNRNICGMLETDIRNIVSAMQNAIFYLHSLSIIHRDIKPESVVIEMANDGRHIYKLTDSGNTKPIDLQHIELGKLSYVAPELIINTTENYGCSVDYWSFGVMVYEIITGSKPFVPHLPLAQWVLCVRQKKSMHISIYEDNNGEYVFTNRIPAENHISSKLVQLFEHWFQLAFEWSPKQRGHIFEKPDSNGLQENDDDSIAPVQVLKFFQSLDEIVAKKILTIFVLTTHMYLSMEVNDDTKMDDLLDYIEQKAGIPASMCHIVMSRSENDIEIDVKNNANKPIDFYADECTNEPMIYVIQLTNEKHVNEKEAEIMSANVPLIVHNVLSNPEKPLKLHTLRQFARSALYFVRHEKASYQRCLNGWFDFATQLNHDIEECQQSVHRMQRLIYGVSGALEIYNSTLKMANANSIAHDDKWLEKITQNIERLVSACDKITVRHSSLHRRSREVCQNELLSKRNAQDYYDIVNLTKAYAVLHEQITRNNIPSKPHFELYQCVCKCLKKRDILLRNNAFIEMKRNLNWIYIELTEIKKTLEKAVIPAKKFRMELIEANKKLHENAWCIATEVPDTTVKTATTTNSTSTTDLTKAFINGLNESLTSSFNAIYTELQEPQEPQHNSLNGKCTLTNSIIEDNINLRIRISDVMNEIDEVLKS